MTGRAEGRLDRMATLVVALLVVASAGVHFLRLGQKAPWADEVRSIELNLLQRCASHLLSETDIRESFELGKNAVLLALNAFMEIGTGRAFFIDGWGWLG